MTRTQQFGFMKCSSISQATTVTNSLIKRFVKNVLFWDVDRLGKTITLVEPKHIIALIKEHLFV